MPQFFLLFLVQSGALSKCGLSFTFCPLPPLTWTFTQCHDPYRPTTVLLSYGKYSLLYIAHIKWHNSRADWVTVSPFSIHATTRIYFSRMNRIWFMAPRKYVSHCGHEEQLFPRRVSSGTKGMTVKNLSKKKNPTDTVERQSKRVIDICTPHLPYRS